MPIEITQVTKTVTLMAAVDNSLIDDDIIH